MNLSIIDEDIKFFLSALNESKMKKSMLGLIKSLFDDTMANKLYANI